MSSSKIKGTKTKSGEKKIVEVGEESSTDIEQGDSRVVKAHYAPDILSAHLCFTAPDRDMVLLPMAGLEFQEDSCKLFQGLDPKDTSEAMIATLAVALWNGSLVCISDGTRQNTPPHVRDPNLRHGTKMAIAAAD